MPFAFGNNGPLDVLLAEEPLRVWKDNVNGIHQCQISVGYADFRLH